MSTEVKGSTSKVLKFPSTPKSRASFYFSSDSFKFLYDRAMNLHLRVEQYAKYRSSKECLNLPVIQQSVHSREVISLTNDLMTIRAWFWLYGGENGKKADWDCIFAESRYVDLNCLKKRSPSETLEQVGPELQELVYAAREVSDEMFHLELRFELGQSLKEAG